MRRFNDELKTEGVLVAAHGLGWPEDAVRGHLLERAGNHEAAAACYQAAASRTASLPERDYLLTQAARVAGSLRTRAGPSAGPR